MKQTLQPYADRRSTPYGSPVSAGLPGLWRAFCRMTRRVTVGREVKPFRRSRSESECEERSSGRSLTRNRVSYPWPACSPDNIGVKARTSVS